MKGVEFINHETIHPNECGLCRVHDQAYEALPDAKDFTLCPDCGQELSRWSEYPAVVSDGDNTSNISELESFHYEKHNLLNCKNCSQIYQVTLTPVFWNANHDVYYLDIHGKNHD